MEGDDDDNDDNDDDDYYCDNYDDDNDYADDDDQGCQIEIPYIPKLRLKIPRIHCFQN